MKLFINKRSEHKTKKKENCCWFQNVFISHRFWWTVLLFLFSLKVRLCYIYANDRPLHNFSCQNSMNSVFTSEDYLLITKIVYTNHIKTRDKMKLKLLFKQKFFLTLNVSWQYLPKWNAPARRAGPDNFNSGTVSSSSVGNSWSNVSTIFNQKPAPFLLNKFWFHK